MALASYFAGVAGNPSDRRPSLSAMIVSMNLAGRTFRRPRKLDSDGRIKFEHSLAKAHQFIGARDNGQLHLGTVGWINILGAEHAV